MRNSRIKKSILYIALLGMAAYGILGVIRIVDFPNEIKLTEQETHNFHFGIPFSATIHGDAVTALKVNNAPVTDNITVRLQDHFTIEAQSSGQAEMTLNAFGLPVKKVTLDIVPEVELVPCGMTIGVRINTDGVMVLGTGSIKCEDGVSRCPADGKLRPGDLILNVNGAEMKSKEDLIKSVTDCKDSLQMTVRRDGETMEVSIVPVKSAKDKTNAIGVWVRDSTKGIGTITYYNPSTRVFGALGHGIMDVDTKKLMSVKDGIIMPSTITSIKKGAKGTPGELEGAIETGRELGQIKTNSPFGIYGTINLGMTGSLSGEAMKVASQSQIHEGPALIRTNVSSNTVKDYDVYIENVNRYSTDETKGMVIRITDPELLKLTNGIVQGMSGSPLIQDGKLIGAVTHVFVQDPTKGYGIFIENMLKQEQRMVLQ